MSSWLRRLAAACLLCAAGTTPALAVSEADLLPVDQAFVLSAQALGRDRIQLTWRVADGYALYKQRMSAQAADAAVVSGALQLPAGKPYDDPFFGRVETFGGQVRGVLDVAAPAGSERVVLRVKYQGCAELGVCYPPQTRLVTVALPAAVTAPAAADAGFAALARGLAGQGRAPLQGGIVSRSGAPLPPEQAFGFEAIVGDGNTLLLRFTPAKGYYLYRDRTQVTLDGASGITPGAPRWPPGTMNRDEYFGNVMVYFDQVDMTLPLRRSRGNPADVTLTTSFQGCQKGGICYPPMTRTLTLALPAGKVTPAAAVTTASAATPGAQAPAPMAVASGARLMPKARAAQPQLAAAGPAPAGTPLTTVVPQSEDNRLAAALSGNNRWWALLAFFGGGLLLAFTPCVLPMIPILSGLVAGGGTRLGTRRALLVSLVYVLAHALVFTAAGIVAGLVGANLQAAFQRPWIIGSFALLFVALALSSFGLYQVQFPAAWRSRLGALSDRQRGGSLAGVAAMGALSALIVGPCVAPPLAAAVLYIGQSQDPVFGGIALFVLALGMGVPLLAFGAAAGRGMPTSGPWMTVAQRVFGFVFLALAVWMLSRLLPETATLALYGLLALAAAAWALSGAPGNRRARLAVRFAGLLLTVVGAAQLLGALGGGRDPLQPLAGVFGAQAMPRLAFRPLESVAAFDRELQAAQAAGKPLLLEFYADWCTSCKEMEKYTLADPAVQAALAGFVRLRADVTANDADDLALMQRFGIIGPPASLFFNGGSERRELRLIGFEKAAPFASRVQRATP